MVRDQLDPDDLATSITAFIEDGYDPDEVANTMSMSIAELTREIGIRKAIGAVSFALILGVIGGFFPAWRAARLNPVSALRYE